MIGSQKKNGKENLEEVGIIWEILAIRLLLY